MPRKYICCQSGVEMQKNNDFVSFELKQILVIFRHRSPFIKFKINSLQMHIWKTVLRMSMGAIAAEVFIIAPVSTLFRQPNSTLSVVKE